MRRTERSAESSFISTGRFRMGGLAGTAMALVIGFLEQAAAHAPHSTRSETSITDQPADISSATAPDTHHASNDGASPEHGSLEHDGVLPGAHAFDAFGCRRRFGLDLGECRRVFGSTPMVRYISCSAPTPIIHRPQDSPPSRTVRQILPPPTLKWCSRAQRRAHFNTMARAFLIPRRAAYTPIRPLQSRQNFRRPTPMSTAVGKFSVEFNRPPRSRTISSRR